MSFKKIFTNEGHSEASALSQHDLPGSYGQRQLEAKLQDFNNTFPTIDHFGTGILGPNIDPNRFEHVPVGFTDPHQTNMFDSDKTETSEPGQGSFSPAWADSTVPDNNDGNNSVLCANTTSAAPGSSRECSCITCVDLGSEREWSFERSPALYPCRLTDCNYSTTVGSQKGEYYSGYYAEPISRKHEKDHFRHEGQFRCLEDRCVYGAKRWSDLKRHYTSKHCLNPKTKFPCPEIDCKYGGSNGFTRKDKLKSHRRTVHEKVANPEKQLRVNKPNAQGTA